jgi:hypothetical protein
MRQFILAAVMSGFTLAAPALAQDTKRYAEGGITFDYPKGWKATTENPGGVVSVTVQNDKGTQAIIQIHQATADPKVVRSEMEKVFRKVFDGKLVKGSEKAAKRKIAGSERQGVAMDFEVAKDVPIHFEFFAFPLAAKKPVVCIVLQYGEFDATEAKKGFDLIAGSLAESGIVKKGDDTTKRPAVVRGKAVTGVLTPANKTWKVVGLEVDLAYISDRDYSIKKYPKEMEGGHVVIRDSGRIGDWVQKGQLTLAKDATLYVAMLVNADGKDILSKAQLDAMAADGWTFLKEPFETTTPDKSWDWKVARRAIKAGEVELPLPPREFPFFRTHVIYVFK